MLNNIKICTTCGVEKIAIPKYFYRLKIGKYGLHSACKDCQDKKSKECYAENKELIKKHSKEYYINNKRSADESNMRWRKANPELSQKYNRKTRATPQGRLGDRMGPAIRIALKNNKSGRTWESLVDYTCSDLKKHLENLFIEDMNWDNMGEWHIDHIIPKSLFNYTIPEDKEFQKCWALSNLQPLWATDNLKKNNKLLGAAA